VSRQPDALFVADDEIPPEEGEGEGDVELAGVGGAVEVVGGEAGCGG
jgi:hypothetical protein